MVGSKDRVTVSKTDFFFFSFLQVGDNILFALATGVTTYSKERNQDYNMSFSPEVFPMISYSSVLESNTGDK